MPNFISKNIVLIILSLSLIALTFQSAFANENQFVLNTIVAVVDNEPITLMDIKKRAGKKKLTVNDIKSDKLASQTLDSLIREKLISAEAEKRRITAEKSEVERYLIEVASKNKLTLSEFKKALKTQGKNLEVFKSEIKAQILRSKISSFLIDEGVTVTEEDIDKFLEDNPQFESPGVKVQIKQIFIESGKKRTLEKAKKMLSKLKMQIEAGEDFEMQAVRYSESPEAKEGGDLGLLDLEDLNPLIQEAIKDIKEGELSEISTSPIGAHLFKLVNRFDNSTDAVESVRKEVREIIQRQKLTEKIEKFFTRDLYNLHAVDKKV